MSQEEVRILERLQVTIEPWRYSDNDDRGYIKLRVLVDVGGKHYETNHILRTDHFESVFGQAMEQAKGEIKMRIIDGEED